MTPSRRAGLVVSTLLALSMARPAAVAAQEPDAAPADQRTEEQVLEENWLASLAVNGLSHGLFYQIAE
jgi:hypothetical protein